jgi:hypothetical protein
MNANQTQAIDGKTFAIGVLTVTACILFIGFLLVGNAAIRPAYGFAMNDRGGDYILMTQQLSNSNESLVVIDAAAKRMIVYVFDYNDKALEILTPPVDLSQMPKPSDQNRPRP